MSRQQEATDAVVVEVLSSGKYTGKVVSVHEGYCFIGEVRRAFEIINTNGDVFCPVMPNTVKVGDLVEFLQLNQDSQRMGKFRTESLTVMATGVAIRTNSRDLQVATLAQLGKLTTYHHSAKKIDPIQAHKALDNMPFAELLQGLVQVDRETLLNPALSAAEAVRRAEDYLRSLFGALEQLGVSLSITEINPDEPTMIDGLVAQYKSEGMEEQADTIMAEYNKMVEVRDVFFRIATNNLLRLDNVIPQSCLVELAVMTPVMFVDAKEEFADTSTQNDPQPDHSIKFFADLIGSEEFAWFYQIYNRRRRPISAFNSKRDFTPPAIFPLIKEAREIFDYVVIATPYHDIASREWADPNWLRNLDPFLLGFKKGLPFIFVLARWSGTGLFPLACDMIADTVNHIRLNRDRLANFGMAYWYQGNMVTMGKTHLTNGNKDSHPLCKFADQLIGAFDEGWLFPFLRGETKPQRETVEPVQE